MEEIIIEAESTEREAAHKKTILAFVFGCISLALSWGLNILFGVLAIVNANAAMRLTEQYGLPRDGRAKAGKILGIIGIILGSVRTVWALVKLAGFIAAFASSIQSGSLGSVSDWFIALGESM